MSKGKLPVLIVSSLLILSLLFWNIYLMNETEKLKEINSDLELKNQMLEGDNDMLSYDIITCRDSIRILNKNTELK